jgi:hypothetical protein
MRINDIQEHFENYVPKKTLKEISWYEIKEKTIINNIEEEIIITKSLINSTKLSFDFDEINKKIKTSDTVYFKDEKVIFVEFKSGGIKKIDFRLKATESIISFYNYIYNKGFIENMCFPNSTFQIYFVYNTNSSSAAKVTFSAVERELTSEYKHLFSKLKVIDNDRFQKIFKI